MTTKKNHTTEPRTEPSAEPSSEAGQAASLETAASVPPTVEELQEQLAEAQKQAAEFKAKCRMSYADCFAAALARLHNAELVTGDQDFRQVENEVKVLWLHD